jgi:hypothetical protein
MFVGHLAVALGSKKVEPKVPLAAAVAASFGIDLLWPILLLVGAERVRIAPGITAFTPLDFVSYPWSHSLAMVLVWSVLAALAAKAWLGDTRVALVLGALVLSHWILDWVTHRPDLPLWPGGPLVGLGLWNSVPATLAVEGSLLAIGVWAFLSATSSAGRAGMAAFVGLLVLCVATWVSGPWSPPPPSANAIAWGGLALWILIPWAGWIDRRRARAVATA